MGPRLVHNLDGSDRAKERWEVILATMTGELTIREACDRLGIEEAMFFRLRTQALQAGLARLEPRRAGRPPRPSSPESERIAELEDELQDTEHELKAMEVRLELAETMPQLVREEAAKKTPQRIGRPKPLKKKQRQRKRAKRSR
jgi:hypothetical protein